MPLVCKETLNCSQVLSIITLIPPGDRATALTDDSKVIRRQETWTQANRQTELVG